MPQNTQRSTTSLGDAFIQSFDNALRTLASEARFQSARPSPAPNDVEPELSDAEKQHAAGLMRVNHSGEVCAQALYQGQSLTAKLPNIRVKMEEAAAEEVDHLAWCEQRLAELGSHTSRLNPLWYGLSFGIGASAGLISDKVSLGFVAATEEQVCQHLKAHLKSLPEGDVKSKTIVNTMIEDEEKHGKQALKAGGYRFPSPVKRLMSLLSKAMTQTSYRI